MTHRLSLTTKELIVIREAMHSITIKGGDAPIVAGLLEKVYKGIDKAVDDERKQLELQQKVKKELADNMAEVSKSK